ncbi:MAG: dihydroneopterin triphosphate diphosphatase [Azonexus sp.]|jgi:dATP pyrophosphohydrolase|nr:dihydroneopterin triphosphate diphosphatase [Azonexus sp.]
MTAATRPMRGSKQPISALVIIHTPQLDVLLLERAAHPGFWQSVTGSREHQETLAETAWREVGEETGLTADDGKLTDWRIANTYTLFPAWRHRYPDGVVENTEHVFSLCLPERRPITPTPTEHRAWQWLPWREASERCFSWSNRDAIGLLPRHFSGA